MSTHAYEQLLRLAFPTEADAARFLTEPNRTAYTAFERAPAPDIAFRFERVRLGVAMSLLKLLADLGDHDESRQVAEVLLKALNAKSVADIDATITRDAKLFEKLYTNLYVNEDGEQLLNLFERTLDADTRPLMDEVLREALALAGELDFSQNDDEDDED
ncbi:hypothetical protein SAMN02745146_1079 [Hymenobacter daecheongensis DSM 21074]|uniref:Uncharacterized protein n=1 Tax=Hymenobacter daecheongensis DSM 21074 TaxID=1121955 RepID=A0A1M6C9A0_9BACT|nr:hypothetical protein [Hymenobacter daecheongensis]SHI57630.1 hypothetical protein SAMN02745146_1079 [Hymenobacter daecheongensis DSM 21074]